MSGWRSLRASLPELPAARRERYATVLGLSAYDTGVLTADLALADYFDAVVAAGIAPKTAANWVTGEFSRLLNQHAAEGLRASGVALKPEGLAELIGELEAGRLSATSAKTVLASSLPPVSRPAPPLSGWAWRRSGTPRASAPRSTRSSRSSPAQVGEYRAGKTALFGFLVGQVMKRTAGRADARLVNEELRRRLAG